MSLVNTKSMLAKLLASENITVEHGNYQTASMDVKNRILRLPIWKEMSGSLYDLMVLHEVGHALYTPEDGWHESASDKGSGYKSFLNVVEDARIERKIKDKYPGGRKAFTEGYLDLIEKDFFGIKGVDLNTLNLIDRINLYFKGGFVHDIEFTEEELEFVEKVRNTMTWDDVVRVTNELYEYAKENESETDMSDHSMMSMADSGDGESEEMEMDMEGEESADFSDEIEKAMDEMKKRGLEAGDEEKEDSETDGPSAENEGEDKDSDSEGESVGDESADDEGDSESKNSSDEPSEDSSGKHDGFGGGASRGEMVEGGKSIEIDPSSFTDKIFRNREGELVQDADSGYVYDYGNMPVADTSKIIVDHKEIHEVITKHYKKSLENFKDSDEIGRAQKGFIKFRSDNKKTVEYLAKEFEMKKAADAHSRTATANSGIIDTGMLHEYKYNEHIFKKINVTADGKNHGLVMVVDWSGSMNGNIKGTIEQMMVLVMFAKRVNIPFEVFLFSDSYPSEARREFGRRDVTGWTHKDGGKNGDLLINGFNLLNVFSSRMRANELHTAYINMTALAQCFDSDGYGYYRGYRTMPSELTLGGTPLNDSLLTMHTYLPEFKVKNNVQIVNLIYLTDGDSAGGEYVWDRRSITRKDYTGNPYEKYEEIRNLERGYRWNRNNRTKTIIRDTKSKKEYTLDAYGAGKYSRNEMTNTLVEILRDAHGVNVVNFYIIPKLSRYDIVDFVSKKVEDRSAEIERLHSCWRKEGHIIGENYGGWTELYLIRGGKNLDVKETNLDVNTGAKKGEIKRAFAKMNKNKLKNRLLLSKFVDMVAA